jgi:hypothetical protein
MKGIISMIKGELLSFLALGLIVLVLFGATQLF